MPRIVTTAAAVLFLLGATTACEQKAAEPDAAPAATLSEADAAAAADALQADLASMDVGKIESHFAKDVVSFSAVTPALSTDWDTFHKRQEDFVNRKFDKVEVADRKIQILDDDTFVVSGNAKLTGQGPVKERTVRFTRVFQKQPDGSWKIVTAHRSFPPAEQPAT